MICLPKDDHSSSAVAAQLATNAEFCTRTGSVGGKAKVKKGEAEPALPHPVLLTSWRHVGIGPIG